MKRKDLFLIVLSIFILVIGFSSCSKENRIQSPLAPSNPVTETKSSQNQSATQQGQAGTTLSAEKTATGFWEKTITYDWTISKTVTPTSIEICSGQTGTVTYTINVTRTKVGETDVYGVRGTITVYNGGDRHTENLKIVDQVEYKTGSGQFQPLPGASQTIIPTQQLGPGDTGTYDYEVRFTPIPGAIYRNSVKVTITNHSGRLGEEFGPEPKADFSLPDEPTIIEIDESATVEDAETCPTGFTCTPSDPGPWTLNDSGTITFTKNVTNSSAQCDSYY